MRPVFASLARTMALVVALVAAPRVGQAQDAGTSPAPASTTTRHRSESGGGSTATVTRGAATRDTTRAASPRPAEDETPIQEQDDGRKADFLWLEVEGGVSYVNLIAFQQNRFSSGGVTITNPSFEEIEGVGPMVGVALGFRIFFLALGARATLASYPGFEIGTVGGEVQFRLPTPIVEPWIRVGAGYAWQGSANYEAPMASASATTVYGWTINAALGLDWFVTWWFSIGFGVSLDVLNMTRQANPTLPCMSPTEFCPSQPGDAIGAQARGVLQLGLHF